MEDDLPYKAEYAKSNRAMCKKCKKNIGQGSLRLAAMVQSAFHDAKQPNWFHEACFFQVQRPEGISSIDNFENLRFEDQERIKKKILSTDALKVGKKRGATENQIFKDFGIEYAKSGRSTCRGCEQKILKDEIRIWKKVFDTEVGRKYGGETVHHHVQCFLQLRNELGWFAKGEKLPGFTNLKSTDQDMIKEKIIENNPNESKKIKLEPKDAEKEKEEADLLKKIKEQTTRLFAIRDQIKNNMSKIDITELLNINHQEPVTGDSEKLLDQIADVLTFGALEKCPQCKGKQLLFTKHGYLCNGQRSEWAKCMHLIKKPKRVPCKVPKQFQDSYSFLKKAKGRMEDRAIRHISPPPMKKPTDPKSGPKVKREMLPLINFQFSQVGLDKMESELNERIAKLGGRYDPKINAKTTAVLSTEDEVKKMDKTMKRIQKLGIGVIPLSYLDAVTNAPEDAFKLINNMKICDWDVNLKLIIHEALVSKSKSSKSVPKSVTLKLKDGLAVDPDSGLDDVAHIYIKNKVKYNAVLGLTDIQKNKNSYYKLQLLESDKKQRFWVFRSWGRIGTTIGGTKLEIFDCLDDAIESFESLFLEKTGNAFNVKNFQKVPGRFYPIDIDYSDNTDMAKLEECKVKSCLDSRLQRLIKLMFDLEAMKRTMVEFNLDTEKMPLGKLSQKQIQSAYQVLTELYELIQRGESDNAFIEGSNRFFTLIPHNFGTSSPPLLNSIKQIEEHRVMLDSLMELECAYNLIKSEDQNETEVNPLDKHYEQLKTKLEPLSEDSKEYQTIKKYAQSTHAETHNLYELEIVNIFKVERSGESRRFKPFKKLHNRKLLWHGSRLTNFVGILSHGLKIAPPEAPVTGYMFGKGIYFADMVSKSANYCCTSSNNPTGIMLLSEVALGDMLECTSAKYITKLPKDKHSVFGRGSTMPDPKLSYVTEEGVEIPLGTPITDRKLHSSLLYNEYIVYDPCQVKIQYLLEMNFKYKQ